MGAYRNVVLCSAEVKAHDAFEDDELVRELLDACLGHYALVEQRRFIGFLIVVLLLVFGGARLFRLFDSGEIKLHRLWPGDMRRT